MHISTLIREVCFFFFAVDGVQCIDPQLIQVQRTKDFSVLRSQGDSCIIYPPLWLRDHHIRRGRKTVRVREAVDIYLKTVFVGHDDTACMDSHSCDVMLLTQLWRHVQDLSKIKSATLPAWAEQGLMKSPCLAEEPLATADIWRKESWLPSDMQVLRGHPCTGRGPVPMHI